LFATPAAIPETPESTQNTGRGGIIVDPRSPAYAQRRL